MMSLWKGKMRSQSQSGDCGDCGMVGSGSRRVGSVMQMLAK